MILSNFFYRKKIWGSQAQTAPQASPLDFGDPPKIGFLDVSDDFKQKIGYFDQTASQTPPSPPHRDFGHPPKIGFLDVSDDFKQKKKLHYKKKFELRKFFIFF